MHIAVRGQRKELGILTRKFSVNIDCIICILSKGYIVLNLCCINSMLELAKFNERLSRMTKLYSKKSSWWFKKMKLQLLVDKRRHRRVGGFLFCFCAVVCLSFFSGVTSVLFFLVYLFGHFWCSSNLAYSFSSYLLIYLSFKKRKDIAMSKIEPVVKEYAQVVFLCRMLD